MKTVTQDYTDNEEAIRRKPVEIYHLWRDGGEDWYYTSGDVAVVYDGQTYDPATIERSSVSYNSQIDLTSLTVKVGYLEDPALEFIAINPVEGIWISVMKLHRDDLTEADVIFLGQLKTVSFKGQLASVMCVGFEHFLKKTVPLWRYQINCNHHVFDTKCALTKSAYLTSTVIALDSTSLILTSADFALEDDGYWVGGEVTFGDESRTVVAHSGEDITLIYKMITLADTDTVSVYPGCDGRIETCRNKYDNILQFLGFAFIPVENPALRVSW